MRVAVRHTACRAERSGCPAVDGALHFFFEDTKTNKAGEEAPYRRATYSRVWFQLKGKRAETITAESPEGDKVQRRGRDRPSKVLVRLPGNGTSTSGLSTAGEPGTFVPGEEVVESSLHVG